MLLISLGEPSSVALGFIHSDVDFVDYVDAFFSCRSVHVLTRPISLTPAWSQFDIKNFLSKKKKINSLVYSFEENIRQKNYLIAQIILIL